MGLTGCPTTDPALTEHVLTRAGYGPDAYSRSQIDGLGVAGYIEQQLYPEFIDDGALDALLAPLDALGLSLAELFDLYGNQPGELPPNDLRNQAIAEKILRAVYSRRQLEAVLTDFWYNHFNVDAGGGLARYYLIPYVRDTIRPHVLGRFEDLLLATARAPAMLDYLDNKVNYKEGYVLGGKVRGLNENYGRELLELHSVSVGAGYTQNDVREAARCLTGWSIDGTYATDGFRFRAAGHDQDPKQVMGLSFPAGGGEQEGVDLLSYLAHHPMTAEHVSRKLVTRFVSENPPQALVDAAADTFLATDGDLRAVVRVILNSPEFLDPANFRTKVKRPLVYTASMLRAMAPTIAPEDQAALLKKLAQKILEMGEPLYQFPAPIGFPDVSGFWVGGGTLINKFNTTHDVAAGNGKLTVDWGIAGGTPAQIAETLIARLFLGGVSADSRAELTAFAGSIPGATDEVRVAETASVALSLPEYLLH